MVEIHKYLVNLWPPQFRTFCELVEGEENKLTTFSTWTRSSAFDLALSHRKLATDNPLALQTSSDFSFGSYI